MDLAAVWLGARRWATRPGFAIRSRVQEARQGGAREREPLVQRRTTVDAIVKWSRVLLSALVVSLGAAGCSQRGPAAPPPPVATAYFQTADDVKRKAAEYAFDDLFDSVPSAGALPAALHADVTGPRRPALIVLYVIDCLRFDHLGVGEYGRDTSPAIDGLARGGASFRRCFSNGNSTIYSVPSLLTGLYAPLYKPTLERIYVPESVAPVAARLNANGPWDALLISENPYISEYYGLDHGFDYFSAAHREVLRINRTRGPRTVYNENTKATVSSLTSVALLKTIEQLNGTPAFVYAHTLEAHEPYAAPGDIAALFADTAPGVAPSNVDAYDAGIRFADRNLSLFVDALRARGLLDDTLLIITGDHGEALLPHEHRGKSGHGGWPEPAKTHIPLIVHWPARIAPGTVVDENVCLLDVAPTLLDLMGYPVPEGLDGLSLVPLLDGKDSAAFRERTIFIAGTNVGQPVVPGNGADSHAVVYKDHYMLSDPDFTAVYDLTRGHEADFLSTPSSDAAVKADLSRALETHIAAQRIRYRGLFGGAQAPPSTAGPEHRESLAALGYAGE